MGKGIKRHQHTVARLLLKGFAPHGKVLQLFRDGRERPGSLKDASVRTDFYTFVNANGVQDRSIEDWFCDEVEAPSAPIVERLRAGATAQPAAEDAPALSRLVAASLLRTAAFRTRMNEAEQELLPLLATVESSGRVGLSLRDLRRSEFDRLVAGVGERLADRPIDALEVRRTMLRVALRKYDELTAQLEGWHWTCERSAHMSLVTSDAPVATVNPYDDGSFLGVLPAGSPAYLPLTPSVLLVASPTRPLVASNDLTPATASMVNACLSREAELCLYRHPDMAWPTGLRLARQRPTLPTPRITRSASNGPPTFPKTYPKVRDAGVAKLLESLGARDHVD